MGSLSLLQGIFPTQGLKSGLPHWRHSLPAEAQGKPIALNRQQYSVNITFIGTGKPKKKKVSLALLWWSGTEPAVSLRYACSSHLLSVSLQWGPSAAEPECSPVTTNQMMTSGLTSYLYQNNFTSKNNFKKIFAINMYIKTTSVINKCFWKHIKPIHSRQTTHETSKDRGIKMLEYLLFSPDRNSIIFTDATKY